MNVRTSWSEWHRHESIGSKQYICGYCGKDVGGHMGYRHTHDGNFKIFLCPNCGLPSLFYGDEQSPGPMIGRDIQGLPDDIGSVYSELRDTAKNGNYTATTLLGRKLIMHIAVTHGAKEGKSFKEYVDFLASKGYVPPNAKKLLEFMRGIGNEKNHEIKLGVKEEVDRIVKFVESLLYFVYELESQFSIDEEPSPIPENDS